ncbi:peptide-N-glycosidase F-related protein [Aliikangiella coralliicola]|nr:peptide-N-glycosidase F-related protein [Aliikangiella coralliicola]
MKKFIQLIFRNGLPWLFFFASFQNFVQAKDGDKILIPAQQNLQWLTNTGNSKGAHDQLVNFPTDDKSYRSIIMHLNLGCADNGCNDWDYFARIEAWIPKVESPLNFEDYEIYELGRIITPYAGYMSRGLKGFDNNWQANYQFDVTDFTPILKGDVKIRAFYGGWKDPARNTGFKVSVNFELTEGTPPRDVTSLNHVYFGRDGRWRYKDSNTMESLYLTPKTLDLSNADSAEFLLNITGHGHALGAEGRLCGEFCSREYYLNVDQQIVAQNEIPLKDCGLTPVYPQAGTWILSRANWCPGEAVYPERMKVPLPSKKQSVLIDLDMEDFTWRPGPFGKQPPYYNISAVVVGYGAPNFDNDATLLAIKSPNKLAQYRDNISCGGAVIEIRNSGSQPLTHLAIEYGVIGGRSVKYQWQGHVDSQQVSEITLPEFNWGTWEGENRFFVNITLPNGQVDEWEKDNRLTSQFDKPIRINEKSYFTITTNKVASENSYEIRSASGEKIIGNNQLDNQTLYEEPLDNLAAGCYTATINDKTNFGNGNAIWVGNGLSWPFTDARTGRGTASLSYQDENQHLVIQKAIQADFGTQINIPFTKGFTLGHCNETTWRSDKTYANAGELVSFKGKVYRSRRWTHGFSPDQSGPWDPWENLGDCTADPRPIDITPPYCGYPAWQKNKVYAAVDTHVEFSGKVYRSRYWSQGFSPDESGPWDPWAFVRKCE